MLGLFGKKSDHPMADLKSAQQVLEDIPRNDTLKLVQEISDWLDSVHNEGEIRLDDRFEVIGLLDQTAHSQVVKLWREFFALDAKAEFQGKRMLKVLGDYHANLVAAYHEVLVGCRDGEKGASSIKNMRPLIVARGINAITGHLKCAAVQYATVADDVWTQLGEYLAEAEAQESLDEPVELYAGGSRQFTVRHELAATLLWWSSGTGSLKPLQIHLSERVAAHVAAGLTLGQEPGEDALVVFDLTQARPPMRYTTDVTAQPSLRFIGYGQVKLQLEPLIAKLEKGVLPGEVNLGGSYDAETVLEVTTRLRTNWLDAPPTRRNARRSLDVNLDIAKGYAGLIDVANLAGKGKGDVAWVAEDVSATGFRCVVDSAKGNGMKVGSLLGFRPENIAHWGAGIVRRMRRNDDGMLDIGVEVLANRAARLKLGEDEGPVTSGDSFAVQLGQVVPGQEEVSLLLKLGNYAESESLKTQIDGKPYLLVPHALQEKGDDYDLGRYRLMAREEG